MYYLKLPTEAEYQFPLKKGMGMVCVLAVQSGIWWP